MKHDYRPMYQNVGETTPDNLLCGGFYGTPKAVNLAHGSEYLRGDILQESATADVYELCDDATKAKYVLLEDRDLTDATATQPGVIHMTGEFNRDHVRVDTGVDLDDVAATLEARNIYLRKTVGVLQAY